MATFKGLYTEVVRGRSGEPMTGSVTVYDAGTTDLASLYRDRAGSVAADNPVITDPGTGRISFYAAPGAYDLVYPDGTVIEDVSVAADPTEAADEGLPTTGGTMTGNLTIHKDAPTVVLNSDAETVRGVAVQTGGAARWLIYVDSTEEAGSDAGSNLNIEAYDDAGDWLGTHVVINRATGAVTVGGDVGLAEAKNIVLGTTTGSKLGTDAAQKLGLWDATPDVQPTTGISAAAFVANTSGISDDTATFGGYTIGQIVAALQRIGALA